MRNCACNHLVLACLMMAGCSAQPVVPGSDTSITRSDDKVEILSKVYHIDRIYPSMTGPWSQTKVTLLDQPRPELVWITGAEVEMLDSQGGKRMPDEFMCHANFDLDSANYTQVMGLSKSLDGRLFTLSQGQLSVRFPKGMGIPIRSDFPLDLVTQALNLNVQDANFNVRHHVTLHFVRDVDTDGKMIPLYESGVSSQVSLEGQPIAFDIMDHGTGTQVAGMCIPGQQAIAGDEGEDRYGRRFTGHWVVPPGRQVNRTRCTSIMNVPDDTRIYAIAVHLHPYAESLELRDVSESRTIFRSEARNYQDKVGLEHIECMTSVEGVPVYANHEYEMISTYNNTSDANADSMAVMYLYLGDTEFNREDALRRIAENPLPLPIVAAEESTEDDGAPRM